MSCNTVSVQVLVYRVSSNKKSLQVLDLQRFGDPGENI